MGGLVGFVVGIVLDGAIEAAGSRRVPLPVRTGLAALLLLFFGGIVGLVLWVGIDTRNWPLAALGAVLGVLCVFWLVYKVRQFRRR